MINSEVLNVSIVVVILSPIVHVNMDSLHCIFIFQTIMVLCNISNPLKWVPTHTHYWEKWKPSRYVSRDYNVCECLSTKNIGIMHIKSTLDLQVGASRFK